MPVEVILNPKTLMLSLQPPTRVRVESCDWDLTKDFHIDGTAVEGTDTPWICTVADLLVDRQRQLFVGLTFQIAIEQDWQAIKKIAQRLDRRVVRYNDISTAEAQAMYPGEAGEAHRFEITWAPARTLGFELAQLLNGQWFWSYSKEGSWGMSPPIIALSISDIDDVLNVHKLSFPARLDFSPLKVEII